MLNVLYLTTHEKGVFDAFDDALKNGWKAEVETGSYQDSPEKRERRLRTYRAYDPVLVEFQDEIAEADTPQEVGELLQKIDLSRVHDAALADLFYTLGPDLLSGLIETLLTRAERDDDVQGVAAFAVIRHNLLAGLSSAA